MLRLGYELSGVESFSMPNSNNRHKKEQEFRNAFIENAKSVLPRATFIASEYSLRDKQRKKLKKGKCATMHTIC